MTGKKLLELLSKLPAEQLALDIVVDYESFTSSRQAVLGVGTLYREGQFLHEPDELTTDERAELAQVLAIYG